MKRLLSWLTGALVMASLMAGLVLPSSVYADDDLAASIPATDPHIADDKIAARDGKVDLNTPLYAVSSSSPGCTRPWQARSCAAALRQR